MTLVRRTFRRGAAAAVLVVGGVGVAIATWVSGEHGLAIELVAIYAVAAVVAYVWSGGKGDVAAIMRIGGDERQRGMTVTPPRSWGSSWCLPPSLVPLYRRHVAQILALTA
jgi:hypothetical protein